MSPAKISLTDSSSNTFLMVRARISATESTLILLSSGLSLMVTVSVTTPSLTGELLMRSQAGPLKMPWVAVT